jgi:hypothetical protein
MLPETYPAPPGRAGSSRIDQLDARILESRNQLHERIHIRPDDSLAGLHALYGRYGKVGQISNLTLIEIQERACGPKLISSNH